MSDNQNTLDIIRGEIEELKSRSKTSGLSYAETKKLETLVKIKNLVLEKPTEIIRNDYDESYTDKEVLQFLNRHIKDGTKKKITGKRPKSKSRT